MPTTRQLSGTRMSQLYMLLILAAAIVAAQPTCVYACKCRPPGTPAEELGRADAVFLGTVMEINIPSGEIASSGDSTTVTFETSIVWKGQIARTLVLTTPGSSASCGVSFEPGKEYVVYGQISDGVLSATLCSRTRPSGDAADDIAALGPGQPPEDNQQVPPLLPATGVASAVGASGTTHILLVAFGILAVGAGAVVITCSRRGRLRGD